MHHRRKLGFILEMKLVEIIIAAMATLWLLRISYLLMFCSIWTNDLFQQPQVEANQFSKANLVVFLLLRRILEAQLDA